LTCRDGEVVSQCGGAGELFRAGTDCTTACDPAGACCDAGTCTIDTAANCSGLYQGDGTACAAGTCTLGSCCQADLTCRDGELLSQCGGAGETFRSGVDCTTACPPCNMADLTGVVFADADPIPADPFDRPGNCAIDAREPHNINDANARNGWDRLVLSYSCDPALTGLVAGDFSVSVGSRAVASLVIDSVADTLTVMFDDLMTPGEWTCIAHAASGSEWCAGYLPADANQNRTSASNDVLALINSINLAPGFVLPMYASDINRSDVITGADILRLIDLLNGAGDFNPWITQQLPLCPSGP